MSANPNIKDAKNSIKKIIKLLESLKQHIHRGEEPLLSRALLTAWCINQYLASNLMNDIEKAIEENKASDEKN